MEEYKYLNVKDSLKTELTHNTILNMESAFFLIFNIWELSESLESKITT